MLTRLQVCGFKNLLDVDIHFGPVTCFAGRNGVGKSNIFDAICFLGALARMPILDAALSIRGDHSRPGDIRHLFHHHMDSFEPEMSFIADMLIAPAAVDDLGQEAQATYTYLRYTLRLRHRKTEELDNTVNPVEIIEEELTYLNRGDFKRTILFTKNDLWQKSVLSGKKTSKFISTELVDDRKVIRLHQDGKRGGKPQPLLAANMPRTVLSTANAAESPTALCARREMDSWTLLQLEPSALRKPDDYSAPAVVANTGEHLPSFLHKLARNNPGMTYQQVTNILAALLDDVRGVRVEEDEKRRLFTIYIKNSDGTEYPAHSLSDGTLRFLALSVLSLDPNAKGLICLEEPENGIHPERIRAMMDLLQDLAVDTESAVDDTNPLRQVILNTHSPGFIAEMTDDSLIMVEKRELKYNGKLVQGLSVSAMSGTWRKNISGVRVTDKHTLLAYLQPFTRRPEDVAMQEDDSPQRMGNRIIDRWVGEQMNLDLFPALSVAEKRVPYHG